MARMRLIGVATLLIAVTVAIGLRSEKAVQGQPPATKAGATKGAAEKPFGIDKRVPWAT